MREMEGEQGRERKKESESGVVAREGCTILQWIRPVTQQSPKNMFMLRRYKGMLESG